MALTQDGVKSASPQNIEDAAGKIRQILAFSDEVLASRTFAAGGVAARFLGKWVFRNRHRFTLWSPERIEMVRESFRAWEAGSCGAPFQASPASPEAGSLPKATDAIPLCPEAPGRGRDDGDSSFSQELLERWALALDSSLHDILNSVQWKIGQGIARSPADPAALHHWAGYNEIRASLAEAKMGAPRAIANPVREGAAQGEVGVSPSQSKTLATTHSTPLRLDVVVCVYNAPDYVKRCLESLSENTKCPYTLYIVDDASDLPAQREIALASERMGDACVSMRNDRQLGYPKSANRGIEASSGDIVVLLNSDTFVGPNWLERIVECAESDPKIGIVGPLSNSAGAQSVSLESESLVAGAPKPPDFPQQVAEISKIVYERSRKEYPRLPIINGFCFAIRREVIDSIGGFDYYSFPGGYHEEYDYCLRAAMMGFECAVADHSYVYHEKGQSYQSEREARLKKEGRPIYNRKHGRARTRLANDLTYHGSKLSQIRLRLQTAS